MTRFPSPTRALHQLDRHRSGTPNTPVAAPVSWAENLAAIRDATPTAAQAMENIRLSLAAWRGKDDVSEHPSDAKLRAASANLMAARLQAELDTLLSRTWRGRLALRLARWTR